MADLPLPVLECLPELAVCLADAREDLPPEVRLAADLEEAWCAEVVAFLAGALDVCLVFAGAVQTTRNRTHNTPSVL